MRLLVTGGLGFIGSNFINYWLGHHSEDSIVNLDKETYAADRNNIDNSLIKDNYEFVKGDICDGDLVNGLVGSIDAIVHFAAESHVDNSILDPMAFVHSNFEGTSVLLEAARKNDVRFHHVSTDEVFGSLELDQNELFNEDSPYNPHNPYSATKAGADFMVRSYVNTYGLNATISNCGNNYGPNQHPEKLIPKAILHALNNEKIPVYGTGRNVRDWVFVEDHCHGIDLVLSKGRIGKTYLISSRNESENLEIIKKILGFIGKSEELLEFVSDRPGHDVRYAIDPSLIELELKWKPKYSLDEGLSLTVEHYMSHYKRYTGKIQKT